MVKGKRDSETLAQKRNHKVNATAKRIDERQSNEVLERQEELKRKYARYLELRDYFSHGDGVNRTRAVRPSSGRSASEKPQAVEYRPPPEWIEFKELQDLFETPSTDPDEEAFFWRFLEEAIPVQVQEAERDTANRRGRRSQYSLEERDAYVVEWLRRRESHSYAGNITDFLIEKFHAKDDDFGRPKKSVSTFHRWKRNFLKRNPNWSPKG